MIITFQLGGQERKIKWDGVQFAAYTPTDVLLGYFTVFGNAVLAHVKDVARMDADLSDNQERLTIHQFVKRFDNIVKDVRSLTEDDIPSLTKTETSKKVAPKNKTKLPPTTVEGSTIDKDTKALWDNGNWNDSEAKSESTDMPPPIPDKPVFGRFEEPDDETDEFDDL